VEHTRIPGGWRTEFLLLAATWGSSFLYIKVLDKQWPAIWVALGRVSLGAVTLLLLTRLRREQVRFEKRVWIHLMVAAALVNAVPFTLFAYGEQHGSSIAAGLWNATTPLWVLAATLAAFGEERPSRGRMLGLAVGFAGVAIVLGPWRGLGGGQLLAPSGVRRRGGLLRAWISIHPPVPGEPHRDASHACGRPARLRDLHARSARPARARPNRPHRA
jgi:hypothetical protein